MGRHISDLGTEEDLERIFGPRRLVIGTRVTPDNPASQILVGPRPTKPADEDVDRIGRLIAPWLVEHGTRQRGRLLPERYAHHLAEEGWWCYDSAFLAAMLDKTLRYTEGVVCEPGGIPVAHASVPHAWLTDEDGAVVEVTPPLHARDDLLYVGVTLSFQFALLGPMGRDSDAALPKLVRAGWTPDEKLRELYDRLHSLNRRKT
jgi:hypothetical protein